MNAISLSESRKASQYIIYDNVYMVSKEQRNMNYIIL